MQVVVRALRVLSLLGEERTDGLSLTEIGSLLDMPLPTAHRLLKVLMVEGFVHRNPSTLIYSRGDKLLRLAAPAPRTTFADTVRPHLQQLAGAFDETAFVAELVGPRAVCVALVESQRPLHLSVRIGHELPLHAAASARVLLAHLPDPDARRLLESHDLTRFTEDTPRSVDAVMDHLRTVRHRGYDVCENELDRHVWAVSARITPSDGTLASLTLAAPMERSADADLRARMVQAVREAAAAVERDTA